MSLRSRIAGLFHPQRLQEELKEEMRSHLEMRAEDNAARGLSPQAAGEAARRQFGNVTLLEEDARSFDTVAWLESLWQDLRYGGRMLRKSPAFAVIAVLTLAIGVGANVAIFSVVNAVLLRPVAYPHPEQLMTLWSSSHNLPKYESTLPDILIWRDQNHVFQNIAWFSFSAFTFSNAGQEPERIRAAEISASMFPTLGVQPILGRDFTADDERWGKHHVVLLSYGLWQRRFGGETGIVGKQIHLNTIPYTVVGVMPRGMPFMDNRTVADLFVPFSLQPGDSMGTRVNYYIDVVARLKPDVTVKQASAEMEHIEGGIASTFPESAGITAKVIPLEKELVGDSNQKTLLVLLGAVGFVLLIACVNVANLMLARSARRQREMAVRAAIGARRGRVLRQLLTEALVLAFCGVVAGLLLAYWALRAITRLIPETLPRFNPISIDANVLLFACAVAFLTALLFGLAPALHSWRGDVAIQLKETGGSVTLDRSGKRLRSLLMGAELALAALLLVCAALTLKSLDRLLGVDAGFEADHVLTFAVPLYGGAEYDTTAKAVQSHNLIVQRLRSIAGVDAAAYSTDLPLGFGGGWGKLVSFPGRPIPKSRADVAGSMFQLISPQYFRTLGTSLRGREFDDSDTADSQQVAIVNQAFAAKFFGSDDPIGKTLLMDAPPGLAQTHRPGEDQAPIRLIVGVARDIKDGNGLGHAPEPRVYVPITQFKAEGGFRTGMYVVRARGDAMALVPSVRNAVHDFDARVPLVNVRTLEDLVGRSASAQRFTAMLLALFGGLALLMAAIGTYGVIANAVAHRTKEIGLRIALGASPAAVIAMVLADAGRVALAGTAVGLALAAIAGRSLRSMLFEVRAIDPASFVAVAAGLLTMALVASYIPARRATRVDPVAALRTE